MRPRVFELDGGYSPEPIPPGYQRAPLSAPVPAQGVPTVHVVEPEEGSWSRAGKYGRSQTGPFPRSLAADPVVIFSIDRQLGPPRPRTLHLFRSDALIVPNVGLNAEIYAAITYGVGGIQNQFFCDWLRGGQISLVCDSLRVEAVPYAPNAATAYTPPAQDQVQVLGAMLSHEGSAPPRPPTFTTQRVVVPALASAVFAVPDFCRRVYPCVVGLAASVANVDDLICLNFASIVVQSVTVRSAQIEGVIIPGGTTQIQINNRDGALANAYLLVFELGL